MLLVTYLGPAAFVGLAVMLFFMPIQVPLLLCRLWRFKLACPRSAPEGNNEEDAPAKPIHGAIHG